MASQLFLLQSNCKKPTPPPPSFVKLFKYNICSHNDTTELTPCMQPVALLTFHSFSLWIRVLRNYHESKEKAKNRQRDRIKGKDQATKQGRTMDSWVLLVKWNKRDKPSLVCLVAVIFFHLSHLWFSVQCWNRERERGYCLQLGLEKLRCWGNKSIVNEYNGWIV